MPAAAITLGNDRNIHLIGKQSHKGAQSTGLHLVHISIHDFVATVTSIVSNIPIVSDENIECILSDKLLKLGGVPQENFGSTDCGCTSHLHYFKNNPMDDYTFWDFINEKRFSKYSRK